MSSVTPTPETGAPRPRRQIELRYFLAGREVGEEDFLAELARQGGRGTVEVFDLAAEDARYRPTPAGQAVASEDATEARR